MMFSRDLGPIIRFHRKKACLSQLQLAQLAHVGKTAVFDIEKGKLSVQLDSILKILDVLNIKLVCQSPLMTRFEDSLNESS